MHYRHALLSRASTKAAPCVMNHKSIGLLKGRLSYPTGIAEQRSNIIIRIAMTRIDKLLSSMGYGSRADIARMARAGAISMDGENLLDAAKRIPITPDLPSRLTISGQAIDPLAGMVILMNKPLGVTCSHKDNGPLVYGLLPDRWRQRQPVLSTVGRLDRETSGLLLLTDDGDLLHRIISPRRHIKKTYRVDLARPLNGSERELFSSGTLMLRGETAPLAPAELTTVTDTQVLLCITEGRYHQVRRMFAAVGNHVERLNRERVGDLLLPDDLAPGQWKLLSSSEIALVFH